MPDTSAPAADPGRKRPAYDYDLLSRKCRWAAAIGAGVALIGATISTVLALQGHPGSRATTAPLLLTVAATATLAVVAAIAWISGQIAGQIAAGIDDAFRRMDARANAWAKDRKDLTEAIDELRKFAWHHGYATAVRHYEIDNEPPPARLAVVPHTRNGHRNGHAAPNLG